MMVEPREQPAPRLTRLDAHGFKSFATRTTFRFEAGITAVVGPNGSGKSNIADAVRWVLGETSYSALRSKKTEDVIFAGGAGRAPAGMAEVTVTFDNADHWLPSEFTEVTVTRRAYRSGENQYLINGRRVRLKDVTLLTASLGQSHTVVGQGLVDQALSQRPDERRGLFEHAADLAGLRLKVAESERNLDEAEGNVTRLADLLAELEPRLRRLERQAKQAQAWRDLTGELRGLQRQHYRRALRIARDRLSAAERHVAVEREALDRTRGTVESLVAARPARVQAASDARDALARHQTESRAADERLRQARHRHDLVRERVGALERRRADLEDTRTGIDRQREAIVEERQSLHEVLADLEAGLSRARVELATRQAASGETTATTERLAGEVVALASEVGSAERGLRERENERALLRQRIEAAEIATGGIESEQGERAERLERLSGELAAFAEEDARIAGQIADSALQLEETVASERQARAEADERAGDVRSVDAAADRARNRLEVLQRLHESGAGLHAGVRQLLAWHREGRLSGVRGTVAELVSVEARYDTAIEVALGGHLQDVVVDAWRDAEAAIGMLRSAQAGRVTFQPVETVARRLDDRAAPAAAHGAGAHGVAADLVAADAAVAPVVRSLLGRTVLVDDLAVARRLLSELPRGFSVVTLAGEISRSGGSVTGGSAVRESGVLGRERELRDLPDEIERLLKEREGADAAHREAVARVETLAAQRSEATTARAGLDAMRKERDGQRTRLQGWHDDLRRERDAVATRHEADQQSHRKMEAALADLDARCEAATGGLDGLRARHAEAQRALAAWRTDHEGDAAALAEARQRVATLDERHRAEGRRVEALDRQERGLADELATRERRLRDLDAEREELAGEIATHTADIAALEGEVEAAGADRAPLETALTRAEAEVADTDAALDAARTALLERERSLGQLGLVAERARAELGTVRQRITDDLEMTDPDALLRTTEPETADHEEVERRIGQLRDRLRRMGYVGEDAVEEYERESAHHEFVRTQLADVEAAAAALRRMLADLRQTMDRRFRETFERVAEAFTVTFTALFGGGTARLVLTSDDGAPGGIDIVAQPPGKRLQGLALLSGGERSLTAVALLVAILRVNPAPFVLLDEVDAALDEANVVRFRTELRSLAAQTQAIVITHNRGTVEVADTLYGVTMGTDGVSQVLSLRLSDLPDDVEVDVRDLPAMAAGVPVR